uniref:Uncharacterized protein n=1 Tax=Steinernema glaseri TaxID=37863 RepID=A0A1I8ACX7_9BILA
MDPLLLISPNIGGHRSRQPHSSFQMNGSPIDSLDRPGARCTFLRRLLSSPLLGVTAAPANTLYVFEQCARPFAY